MQTRRRIIFFFLAGICACSNLSAQTYPAKPVRLIVGLSAGGAADISARLVAQKLSEKFSQPVLVENRTGAGGSLAAERLAKSPADGYTLGLLTASNAALPALNAKLPYNLERDFVPVSLIVDLPFVLVVHPSGPARSVKELLSLARAQPGKLTYGSAGIGSGAHLAAELFKFMAKVDILHVPYKGGAEASVALAAGQIDLSLPAISSVLPLLDAGNLRALAVSSAKRASLMPSIPTLDESGVPGYDRSVWYGIAAPAGVPSNIITRLNGAITDIVNTAEMKEALRKQGLQAVTNTPGQFAALLRDEIAANRTLIAVAGVKAE
jgi:tripartite-type tricarboxylate transporter receptor subunit TctC